MDIAEHELGQFLAAVNNDQLRTWQRRRTCEELRSLVMRRLEMLDEEGVELVA